MDQCLRALCERRPEGLPRAATRELPQPKLEGSQLQQQPGAAAAAQRRILDVALEAALERAAVRKASGVRSRLKGSLKCEAFLLPIFVVDCINLTRFLSVTWHNCIFVI